MPFPTYSGTKSMDQALAWSEARGHATAIKSSATALKQRTAAGQVSAYEILDFAKNVGSWKARLLSAATVPGIAQYVKNQLDDQTIDIVADFNAMLSALDACLSYLINSIPQDASNYLLVAKIGLSGDLVYRQLSSGETSGLRTQLDTLLLTLD